MNFEFLSSDTQGIRDVRRDSFNVFSLIMVIDRNERHASCIYVLNLYSVSWRFLFHRGKKERRFKYLPFALEFVTSVVVAKSCLLTMVAGLPKYM